MQIITSKDNETVKNIIEARLKYMNVEEMKLGCI